uniref:Uncharacterized protein LOC111124151 n=1 Tax=Crassostrea virginica TaxID=6565 RepID=A0A8B8D3Q6_CRAVI|nr:uncharacterized protein LOC111124151 [Crassostrea virginica]
MALQTISESLYVGLCLKVGTSQQVAIRRDVRDITELLRNKVTGICIKVHCVLSGSRREGFRFEDSDCDFMGWPTDHPVLWDFSQAQFYNTHRDTLILCDSSESPPGFTLLWLPLEKARHKLGIHTDIEWRISFSQAEQKLMYAMNHTQFLIYALLKMFVKEINYRLSEEEKLLCSYHIKTAVLWAIQENAIHDWCPQNLLAGFWVCFKLLLKWVYEGVCPNFFIPENNMFLNKVYGEAQKQLFTQLYSLYEKGIAFLLHIPSINSYIMNVFYNPRLSVCTDEQTLISEVRLDAELFYEIDSNSMYQNSLLSCMEYLQSVEQVMRSPLTQCQIITLQKHTADILQCSALMLHDKYTNTSGVNKQIYIADKLSCYMLKLAVKFGCVSDLLYIAMYFYKTLRQREALSVIEMTKVKLVQQGLMYNRHVDPERYTEAVGGRSWSAKMRNAVAQTIKLDDNICYINELTLEQQSCSLNESPSLYIPPFLLLHMLEFLCCRHADPRRAQAALDELRVLVHHDQGLFVPVHLKEISWEILGICQQMAGNHQAALYSYEQSLRQEPFNRIYNATRHRIQDLH